MNDIMGSKPRQLIKRTILTNPSLISLSVTSIFDPENQSLPKIYKALENKQKLIEQNDNRVNVALSSNKIFRQASLQLKKTQNYDSLQEAQKQFMSHKHSQPKLDYISPKITSDYSFKSGISKNASSPNIFLNSLNFKNTRQIKIKQAKPYNIINNL